MTLSELPSVIPTRFSPSVLGHLSLEADEVQVEELALCLQVLGFRVIRLHSEWQWRNIEQFLQLEDHGRLQEKKSGRLADVPVPTVLLSDLPYTAFLEENTLMWLRSVWVLVALRGEAVTDSRVTRFLRGHLSHLPKGWFFDDREVAGVRHFPETVDLLL